MADPIDVSVQPTILAPDAVRVLVIGPDGKSVELVDGASLLAAYERAALARAEGEAPLGETNRLVSQEQHEADMQTVSASLGSLGQGLAGANQRITDHNARTDNPHGVTKAQVGLGNVDNTPDADKPVSTAQQAALAAAIEQSLVDARDAVNAAVADEASARATAITEILDLLDSHFFEAAAGTNPYDAALSPTRQGDLAVNDTTQEIWIAVSNAAAASSWVQIPALADMVTRFAAKADAAALAAHTTRTDNPHSTTKAQVGLANVDNVSVLPWIAKCTLGTCDTAQATTEKVVALTNYARQTGDIIAVLMTYGAAASATLNVNDTGAAAIKDGGSSTTASSWAAGDLVRFVWDGTYWREMATQTPGSGPLVWRGGYQGTAINESYLRSPASGARWQGVPRISSAGAVDVGAQLFFYTTATASAWNAYISAQSDSSLLLRPGNTNQMVYVVGGVVPNTANTFYCGISSLPWAGGYTQTAFTVTSAREAKTAIRDFTAAELAVARAIVRTCPRVYQLATSVAEKGTDAARLHSGCIYEEVYQAFVDGGLDPERYSIFCASPRQRKTTRTETREVFTVLDGRAVVTMKSETVEELVHETLPMVDSAGNPVLDKDGHPRTYQTPVYETDESGAVMQDKGLRYEELQIWIAAGLRELATISH